MTAAFLLICALLALVWSAFCSGAETCFLSVSRERILHLAREGGRKAKIVQKSLSDMGRTTTILLVGNNLANVIYSSSTAALSAVLFGEDATLRAVWAFFAAFTVLYVSEFLPKLLCAARPLRRSLRLADAYRVMAALLGPLGSVALWVTNLFVPVREARESLTAADLTCILQDRKDGVCLTDFESALITRLLVLRRKGEPVTPEAILSALREAD